MDYAKYFDKTGLASPFYRVSLKAIVRDDAGRVLVTREPDGVYELPGGGWDHDEDLESGLAREIEEELGVRVARIAGPRFVYKGRSSSHPHVLLRIAAEVWLESHGFAVDKDEVAEARFVGREEFLTLNWSSAEGKIIEHVDTLWPAVEKNSENR
jgi:8-oxo-dGTP diphosphatase